MNVSLVSHFHNATRYLDRYLTQAGKLQSALHSLDDTLMVIWGEGDSTDTTRQQLQDALPHYHGSVINVSHGGPVYGSVVHPERFRQLAYVCNSLWSCLLPSTDAVLFVESDLVWQTETMLALLDRLETYPVIAPMVFHQGTRLFYDVWAARNNGQHFSITAPYGPGYREDAPFQVESMGSVLAMQGAIARHVTWPEDDVVVGVCRQVYELGYTVWIDPALVVEHP